MERASVSRVSFELQMQNQGIIELDIFRHLAPFTVAAITRAIPIEGRIARYRDEFVYFPTPVVAGSEKARHEFKRSEIAFLPANGAICIFLKDTRVAQPMNPIGKVASGIELIEAAASGETIQMRKQ